MSDRTDDLFGALSAPPGTIEALIGHGRIDTSSLDFGDTVTLPDGTVCTWGGDAWAVELRHDEMDADTEGAEDAPDVEPDDEQEALDER